MNIVLDAGLRGSRYLDAKGKPFTAWIIQDGLTGVNEFVQACERAGVALVRLRAYETHTHSTRVRFTAYDAEGHDIHRQGDGGA